MSHRPKAEIIPKLIIGGLLFVAIFAFAYSLTGRAEAQYTNYCSYFKEGYVDGYCSVQNYSCLRPLWYPTCYENDYQSSGEAYHVGFEQGRVRYLLEEGRR